MKNIRGQYYLNGHWTVEGARALPVASTFLHYERGAEGDLAPERLHARGPTSEPLVIEVSVVGGRGPLRPVGGTSGPRSVGGLWGKAGRPHQDPPAQLISQEPNPGVRYEYYLPWGAPRPGFSWSHGSWSDCSAECDGGEGTRGGSGLQPCGGGGQWMRHLCVMGVTLGKPRGWGTP